MKKIYLYNADNQLVDNIEKIHITAADSIPNGSCELIVCDCLDGIPLSERTNTLKNICKKAALKCRIILKFISLKLFGKYVFYDKISIEDANLVIQNSASLIDESTFDTTLVNLPGFVIVENAFNGMVRTITIERIK